MVRRPWWWSSSQRSPAFIGAPVIRMRGDYLATVTPGFGEIIRLLFLSDRLGGICAAQGVTNIPGVNVFGLTVKARTHRPSSTSLRRSRIATMCRGALRSRGWSGMAVRRRVGR